MRILSNIQNVISAAAVAVALSWVLSTATCPRGPAETQAVGGQSHSVMVVADKGSDGQETHG